MAGGWQCGSYLEKNRNTSSSVEEWICHYVWFRPLDGDLGQAISLRPQWVVGSV